MSEWMACNFWSRQPLAAVEEQSLQTHYSVVQALASDVAFTQLRGSWIKTPSRHGRGSYTLHFRMGYALVVPSSCNDGATYEACISTHLVYLPKDFYPTGIRDNGEQLLIYSIGAGSDIGGAFRSIPCGTCVFVENFRRSDKRKAATDSKEETSIPRKGIEDAGDSRRTGRGWKDPSSEVEDRVSQDQEASRTLILSPTGKYGYINIGSRWDELDPTILGKLPAPAAIAAVSVHKYWTLTYRKAADNA
ncbi:hypothetical protein Fot_19559 [Forsythia ovata]|uniref:Uncharacterized protein n=1 Tax=Forsythia ovata TaxID=205694 RepID=A0ABD1VLH0_9LAMI